MFKLAVGSKLLMSPFDTANAALLSSVSPLPLISVYFVLNTHVCLWSGQIVLDLKFF